MDKPFAIDPPKAPPKWSVPAGIFLAYGLFVFDLLLGSVATYWPDFYLSVVHPELDHPQVELLRRTGALWLCFSLVALIAATRDEPHRASWFLVLGWFRLIEVPADIIYGIDATGTGILGRVVLYAVPPVNLAIGGYFFWLSRRIHAYRLWRGEHSGAKTDSEE